MGNVLLWTFVAMLTLIYVMAVFGPPPPSERALALSGVAGWLFVAWGYWIDRHREPVTPLADNRRLSSGTR